MQLRRAGHIVFALGYTALAAVVALLLAVFRPQTDEVVIVLAAAVVLLAGGLAHEVTARLGYQRKINERLVRMRQAYEDLVDLILKTRTEKAKSHGGDVAPAPAEPAAPEPPPARRPPSRLPRPAAAAADGGGHHPPALAHDDGAMAAVLREALAENRVETYLQPIVGLPQRKHRAYEVLSRLRLSDGSLLQPDRYLAVAERDRLLPVLDLLMVGRAAQLIRETDLRRHAISFFCNVSAQTLTDGAFMAQVLGPGGGQDGVRAKLVIEMSQRDLSNELAAPAGVVRELAQAGYRLSMDQVDRLTIDVEALIEHGVRFLKLNCAFFSLAERRTGVMALRRRLTGQPIDVIVEKIETEHQLKELEDLGIELAQGFLFGEPRLTRRVS